MRDWRFREDDVKTDEILQVRRETRELVARPDSNFEWSDWESLKSALREIDSLIDSISTGALLDTKQLGLLFAPTGPVREVSLSNGWALLKLAARFDAAMQ
jgi:hypothetical protein